MPRRGTKEHDFSVKPLGYRPSPTKEHREKYAARRADVAPTPEPRPFFRVWKTGVRYDQGVEGACVGHAIAGFAATFDYNDGLPGRKRPFNAEWIYAEAKKIDEWEGDDYEGTSVRAGFEVARLHGIPLLNKDDQRVYVHEYRWANTSSDVLDYLANIGPAVFGLAWYESFDNPVLHPFNGGKSRKSFFIGEGDLGNVRGGHAILANGYYRNRYGNEWIRFQNSWGFSYPFVWMPKATLDTLFNREEIEVAFPVKSSWQQLNTI